MSRPVGYIVVAGAAAGAAEVPFMRQMEMSDQFFAVVEPLAATVKSTVNRGVDVCGMLPSDMRLAVNDAIELKQAYDALPFTVVF